MIQPVSSAKSISHIYSGDQIMIQPSVGAGLKTPLRQTAGLLSQSIPICGDHILLSMDRSVPVSTTTSIALRGGWDSVCALLPVSLGALNLPPLSNQAFILKGQVKA